MPKNFVFVLRCNLMNKNGVPGFQELLGSGNLSPFFSARGCMKLSYFLIALCLCLFGCSHSNTASNPPAGGNFRVHITDSLSEAIDNDTNTRFALLSAYWTDSVNSIWLPAFTDSTRAVLFCNQIKMQTSPNSAEYFIFASPAQRDSFIGIDSTLHFTNQFNHEIAAVRLNEKPIISFHDGDTIPAHIISSLTVFPEQPQTLTSKSYARIYVNLDQGGIYSSAYGEQLDLSPKTYIFRPDTLPLNILAGPHELTVIIWYYDMLSTGFDRTAIQSLGAVQEVATRIKIYVK